MFPMLGAYLHNLDPFLIEFWPGVGLRWYGLSYLAGFVLAYGVMRMMVRQGRSSLQLKEVGDLVVAMGIGVLIGGRLGYVFFYSPDLLISFTDAAPWWGVLALNRGGMASHGGMIGAVAGAGWYAWRHRHSWGHLLDLAALGTPLGLLMGRLANFINGELYGRPCAHDFPLAVQFPSEIAHWPEARWEQLALLVNIPSTQLTLGHVMKQLHKGDAVVTAALQATLTPRHPSQLYEALAEGLILFLILLAVYARPRKPWTVGGWFLVAYGVLRIACEQFREPDAGIGYQLWGLTRGQWLSVGLVGAGVGLWVLAWKLPGPALGGWRRMGQQPTADRTQAV